MRGIDENSPPQELIAVLMCHPSAREKATHRVGQDENAAVLGAAESTGNEILQLFGCVSHKVILVVVKAKHLKLVAALRQDELHRSAPVVS